jgi:hypothetical protein
MMACLAARERTKGAWEELLRGVGPVIQGVWAYTRSVYEKVMAVKRR